VLYVEELIAPDVVNTMPEGTLRAFADHGDAGRTFDMSADAADETLRRAGGAGLDLAEITAGLERAGVESFRASYDELLHCIDVKVRRRVALGVDRLALERWVGEGGRWPA
jgi:transaldolase